MIQHSTVQLCKCGGDVWSPKPFPQRVSNRSEMLMGTSRAPAFPRCSLVFFCQGLYPWKGVALGQKRWILLTAPCWPVLCVTLQRWLCSVQQKGRWLHRGAGLWKCQQNLATGNPAASCSQQTLLCSAVQVINTGRKMKFSSYDTIGFYTVELLNISIERTKIFCSTHSMKSIKHCYRKNTRSGSMLLA